MHPTVAKQLYVESCKQGGCADGTLRVVNSLVGVFLKGLPESVKDTTDLKPEHFASYCEAKGKNPSHVATVHKALNWFHEQGWMEWGVPLKKTGGGRKPRVHYFVPAEPAPTEETDQTSREERMAESTPAQESEREEITIVDDEPAEQDGESAPNMHEASIDALMATQDEVFAREAALD